MTAPTDVGPTGREVFVTSSGTRLHVLDFGDAHARPVLAVHGFASSAQANWVASGWVRALAPEGYRIVAVDLRGHGGSDKPHDAASYTLPLMVNDIRAVINDLNLGAVDLLGYSMGSRVCIELAATGPELVRTLSLGGIDDSPLMVGFDVGAARGHVMGGTPIADEKTASLMAMMQALPGSDVEALLALADGLQAADDHAPTPLPDVPALVVCGEKDAIAPGGEAFAASLPLGAFVSLKGRTHANAVTARAFKAAVLEHLAGH